MHPDVKPSGEDVREWTSFEVVLPNHHYTFPDNVEDIKDWLVPITFRNRRAIEDNGTVLRAPAEATVTEVLGSRYCNGCCRIRMNPTDPSNSEPLNLVCKFMSTVRDDLIKSLEDEANLYETQLKTLQGSVVPKFYGYYKLDGIWESNPQCKFVCILLEDCGNVLEATRVDKLKVRDKKAFKLNLNDRIKIFKNLIEIHMAGVYMKIFEQRNVVVRDGNYRIIDFEFANAHKCDWKGDMCQFIAQYIAKSEGEIGEAFGCTGLAFMGCELGLWEIDIYSQDTNWYAVQNPSVRCK